MLERRHGPCIRVLQQHSRNTLLSFNVCKLLSTRITHQVWVYFDGSNSEPGELEQSSDADTKML
jgi:hypothetical protein